MSVSPQQPHLYDEKSGYPLKFLRVIRCYDRAGIPGYRDVVRAIGVTASRGATFISIV